MRLTQQAAWLERAKETHKFHADKCKKDSKWKLINTAKALKRSLGSICEDLLIASWLKTHRIQLERFDYAYEALEFIRKKKEQMSLEEIE